MAGPLSPAKPWVPVPADGGEGSVGGDAEDAVGLGVGEVEIAGGVEGEAAGEEEFCGEGGGG